MAAITIVSGGQTGADRAGLDAAVTRGLPYRGWTPLGGWAEDMARPPGLLACYPLLTEAESPNPARRTWLNVRDSDATLILWPRPGQRLSAGTALTRHACRSLGRPFLLADPTAPSAALDESQAWLSSLGRLDAVNIAGPRESQAPGVYAAALAFLEGLFAQAPFV